MKMRNDVDKRGAEFFARHLPWWLFALMSYGPMTLAAVGVATGCDGDRPLMRELIAGTLVLYGVSVVAAVALLCILVAAGARKHALACLLVFIAGIATAAGAASLLHLHYRLATRNAERAEGGGDGRDAGSTPAAVGGASGEEGATVR